MDSVHVLDVRDGNTLAVSPPWKLGTKQGCLIRIRGFRAYPLSLAQGQLARYRLTLLLLGAVIQIENAEGLDDQTLVCDVMYQGQSLQKHFPEYVDEPVKEKAKDQSFVAEKATQQAPA